MTWKTHKFHKRITDIETGIIRKKWNGRIKVALVYPNTYHVGMSNLGFQTVYELINAFEHVVCERSFLPNNAGSDQSERITTIESGNPISAFDLIAFSVSYENDYPNLLTILEKAKLPLQSSDRGIPHPLVIAGGVAFFLNPEPLTPFIDCFLIGWEHVSCLRGHRTGTGACLRRSSRPGIHRQEHLLDPPREGILAVLGRDSDRCRARSHTWRGRCELRDVSAVFGCVPYKGLDRSICAGCSALHFVPDDRVERPYPCRTPTADRESGVRM